MGLLAVTLHRKTLLGARWAVMVGHETVRRFPYRQQADDFAAALEGSRVVDRRRRVRVLWNRCRLLQRAGLW